MSSIAAIAGFSPDRGSARKAIASLAKSELPDLACAVLALIAIWGHRYRHAVGSRVPARPRKALLPTPTWVNMFVELRGPTSIATEVDSTEVD